MLLKEKAGTTVKSRVKIKIRVKFMIMKHSKDYLKVGMQLGDKLSPGVLIHSIVIIGNKTVL